VDLPVAYDRVDVAIVGAGLAGLHAAGILSRAGLEVRLLEAADRVGGRVATDRMDGFTLDRGFQLLNPAYPEGRRAFRYADLDLRAFPAGVEVVLESGRQAVLDDPRRSPASIPALARLAIRGDAGRPWELAALGAYVAGCATATEDRLAGRPDVSLATALRSAGVRGGVLDRVVVPFLSGVLAEEALATSRRVADPILRSFARGVPSLPAQGMDRLAQQLAACLPAPAVQLGDPVRELGPGWVRADSGEVRARAVLVATSGPAAATLVRGLTTPPMRALTTWYFTTASPSGRTPRRLLVDGAARDLTPRALANVALVSATAPSYAPPGQSLVAATAVGHHPADARAREVAAVVARWLGLAPGELRELARYPVADALPALVPPLRVVPARLARGLFVAGDHVGGASIQGALASGRRAAEAIAQELGAA